MMLAAGKQIAAALGDQKPHTAVSGWIDTLCTGRYGEEDLDGIPELVESINLQATGPTEASRAIRKKLKYSDVHGQLRALVILNSLVLNCGARFQATFANERLVDRIRLSAGDPTTDTRVKKKLMLVLAGWHREFKDDPRMQLVAGLYHSCGGGAAARARNAASEAYEQQRRRQEEEAGLRAARRLEKEEQMAQKERAKRAKQRGRRPPFNFEAEKPRIMNQVAQSTQSAQSLINALQRVNRERESVTTNERVQECLNKAKADRKLIIRYVQLIDNDGEGDYVGTLLSTNDTILRAIELYDQMSKPAELDSDDEQIQAVKADIARSAGGLKPQNTGGDTESIRSRLSAFDMQDREVDKLQRRQRERVLQHSARQRSNVHPDLHDLAFGGAGPSAALPEPLAPRASHDDDNYSHGSLSEFSDYSSESDGEVVPSTSASGSGTSTAQQYAAQHSNQLIDDDDDDPFADPDDEVHTPGIAGKEPQWR